MPDQVSSARLGYALAAAGAVLFSLKAIVVKLSYVYGVDAVTVQTLRMAMALPAYVVIALLLPKAAPLTARQWLGVVGLGLTGYHLASYLDLSGLAYISAGLERLILFAYPTLSLLFSRVLFGRRIQRVEVIAIVISYLGLALVFAEDLRLYSDGVVVGSLLVFGSAAAYALFMIGSGRLIPQVGSMRYTCYAMISATLGIGTHFLITRPTDLTALPTPVYGLGMVLALGCTVLPSFLLMAGIARIGGERASLVGLIGPASTLLAANLVLGEPITPINLAGSALILAGVLSISLGGRKTKVEVTQPARQQVQQP